MTIERGEQTPDRVLGQRATCVSPPRDGPDARSLAESVRMALMYLEEIGARPPPVSS